MQSRADAGPGTMREAIEAANAAGGGDIDCRQLTGLIEIASPLPGFVHSVRVLGPEPTQGSLNVSGGGAWPLFSFVSGTTSVISRLTLSRAVAKDYRHGAAISNAGSLRIESCLIVSNRTEGGWGGGIYNAGDLSLEGVELRANVSAGGKGGNSVGLFSNQPTVSPGGGGAGFGGAIFQAEGTLTLSRCRLTDNRATGGMGGSYAIKATEVGDGRGGGPAGGVAGQDGGFGSGAGGSEVGIRLGYRGGFGGGSTGENPPSIAFGGGAGSVYVFNGTFPLAGCGAGMGGGVFVRGGQVTFLESDLQRNVAEGGIGSYSLGAGSGAGVGAAVFVYGGRVQLDRCRVEGNVARMVAAVREKTWDKGGGDGRGGGIALFDGHLAMASSAVLSNRVAAGDQGAHGLGGGFYQYGGTSVVSQTSWIGNQALGGVPGSQLASFSLPAGDGLGGGAWIEGGHAEFENCTVANNRTRGADNYIIGEDSPTNAVKKLGRSRGAGLGIDAVHSNLMTRVLLRHCTVAGNQAERSLLSYTFLPVPPEPLGETYGGGIYVGDGMVELKGTLCADNKAVDGTDVWGSIHSTQRNLVGKSAGGTGWSTTDLVDVDARLGPLVSQGPFAWVRVPLTNSPAVDAADAVELPRLDQRWIARPQGVAGDIGAVELTEDPTAPMARFSGLGLGPNRTVMFHVSGPTHWTHRLERSLDLRTWEAVGPVAAGGEVSIPIGADLGIYRVWSPPAEW
ncbi:MAG: hypothetical protein IT581_12870 [Verrucomicrobiales bacterium]|nr:hypothetical protein [Verrucomicrobiales bacterium]